MNLALYLGVACSILCELLLGVVLINGLLGKEAKIPKLWMVVYVVIATVYILIVPDGLTTGCYILTILYVRYGYKETWKDSIIITILSVVLVGIVELVCSFPFSVLFYGRWTDTINNLLSAFCSLVICCLLVRIVPIGHLKKWSNRQEVIYVIVVLFCLILMMSTIVNFHMTLELDVGDYIYILIAVTLVWFLSLRLMRYQYEEKFRKEYFDAFCSVIDQIKRRQHKFQNQLDAIYSLHQIYNDYESLVREQRNYMGKLADYELPTNVLILENPIIIAHLYEKLGEAQETGVRVRLKLCCSLAGCELNDIHLVEIFGTFLDNAVQDMQAAGEREFLYIEIKEENGILIRVANPHDKMKNSEIQKMFEKGYSTKGEDRGIGLYHVRKLVQKFKIDLIVENQVIEERNYICFSLLMGRKSH